ncbi:hypothetical protein [Gloeobacter violaceus]|uniref:Gsl4005 protein n=1 Tax=Gloeobacter violaceus (strain ATCC 29082 / PCC 7421) TaxID=251221 RepID=Q7NE75_GLOVI|nr:hypothetical protein [Gloeobacter violaceus]BAC91946.1 gsl4005 [Gloeobacter violaceus PCC 7421]
MLLTLLLLLLVVCLGVQFFVIQQTLKQTDQQLEDIQRAMTQTRLAPGTQPYCRTCRYYGSNRYIVCALHPEGWTDLEAGRCVDFDGIACDEKHHNK